MDNEFEMPEIEIITLDGNDIITTSGCQTSGIAGPNELEML